MKAVASRTSRSSHASHNAFLRLHIDLQRVAGAICRA
ncbi:putative leader peptide [Streptomyces sp. NPDC088725]